jgi:Glutathione-dependent formaldehyde-activating enzyme
VYFFQFKRGLIVIDDAFDIVSAKRAIPLLAFDGRLYCLTCAFSVGVWAAITGAAPEAAVAQSSWRRTFQYAEAICTGNFGQAADVVAAARCTCREDHCMTDTYEGGCQCGGCRYRVRGTVLTLFACYCKECQKQTGSAFSMALWIKTEAEEVLSGRAALRHPDAR